MATFLKVGMRLFNVDRLEAINLAAGDSVVLFLAGPGDDEPDSWEGGGEGDEDDSLSVKLDGDEAKAVREFFSRRGTFAPTLASPGIGVHDVMAPVQRQVSYIGNPAQEPR